MTRSVIVKNMQHFFFVANEDNDTLDQVDGNISATEHTCNLAGRSHLLADLRQES